MNRFFASIGLLLTMFAAPGVVVASSSSSNSSSSSSPSTLYTRIKQQVERETSKGVFDDDVVTFLRLIFKKQWNLTDAQVKDVLEGNTGKACTAATDDSPLRERVPCQTMVTSVLTVARQEQRIRTLGRNLSTLVAGYELPLSELPDQTFHLSTDLLGILNIWSAGTGSIRSTSKTPVIRTVSIESSVLLPRLDALANALKPLSTEERTAAIWRYRYGVLLTTGRRAPQFPKPILPDAPNDGTERQYLSKEWISVQNALLQLWEAARTTPFNPPIAANEIAYVRFVWKGLPDNMLVWIRLSSDITGSLPLGDAGLDWKLPLEPVFPSLKKDGKDEAIPGGNYPPEPVIKKDRTIEPWNGMQLCSNPFARRGYLCRPFEASSPGERCPVEVPADNDTIALVHCTVSSDETVSTLPWCLVDDNICEPMKKPACMGQGQQCGSLKICQALYGCTPSPVPAEPVWCCLKKSANQCAVTTSSSECVERGGSPSADEEGCVQNGCDAPVTPDIRYTTAGADVCREIGWKNNEPFDPKTQCTLNVRCDGACDTSTGLEGGKKDASGKIDVCISDNPAVPATYQAFHELVHAYQLCNQPLGTIYEKTPAGTSQQERKNVLNRNTELCCRMEGEAFRLQCAMQERDGVFADAQSCAEALTDDACRKEVTIDGEIVRLLGCFVSKKYPAGFADAIRGAMSKNPKNVPVTCADAINPKKMDPRVKALKEEVERRDDVCTPATETSYMNRIGNNICFVGQCAEQSLELHRISAGQSPAGVEGAVAPWQEPLTGTPLGNLLSNPPLSQYRFPPYRPELLVRTMDSALCESAGLPPLMPPGLCAAEATRQLTLTRGIGLETMIGLVGQNNQQQIDLRDVLKLSRGIGVRTGTELYSNYLRESSRSFAEIIGMAAELLQQLNSISFPTQMCPISPGMPPPLSSEASAQGDVSTTSAS